MRNGELKEAKTWVESQVVSLADSIGIRLQIEGWREDFDRDLYYLGASANEKPITFCLSWELLTDSVHDEDCRRDILKKIRLKIDEAFGKRNPVKSTKPEHNSTKAMNLFTGVQIRRFRNLINEVETWPVGADGYYIPPWSDILSGPQGGNKLGEVQLFLEEAVKKEVLNAPLLPSRINISSRDGVHHATHFLYSKIELSRLGEDIKAPPAVRGTNNNFDEEQVNEKSWDAFIIHASEDKDMVVLPLQKELESEYDLRIWVDKGEVKLGDSLAQKINEGLRNSKAAIAVLSPSFLKKPWPRAELDAFQNIAIKEERRFIPLAYGLEVAEALHDFPLLGRALGARIDVVGVKEISAQIAEALGVSVIGRTTYGEGIEIIEKDRQNRKLVSLLEIDQGRPLSELDNGVFGYATVWDLEAHVCMRLGVISENVGKPQEIRLQRDRDWTHCLEIQKWQNGVGYVVGFTKDADYKKFRNGRSPIGIRLASAKVAGASEIIQVPISHVMEVKRAQANGPIMLDLIVLPERSCTANNVGV